MWLRRGGVGRSHHRLPWFVFGVWLIAGVSLMGWLSDSQVMKSLIPGLVAMNPLTAVCFAASGAALCLASQDTALAYRRARWVAGAIAIAGAWCLLAQIFGWPIRPDIWLFGSRLDLESIPNRMAPNTALAFFAFACSIFLLEAKWKSIVLPSQLFVSLSGGLGFITILGYAFSLGNWQRFGAALPMALHTGIGFICLTAGVYCLRAGEGLLYPLSGIADRAVLGRRLMVVAAATPVLAALVAVVGQEMGLFPSFELALAVAVVTVLAVVCSTIWFALYRLRMAEDSRNEAVKALEEAHKILADRVEIRTQELATTSEQLANEASERRKLNVQLMHSQKMEGIGRLAGGIAHDFNNLLTGILGYSEIAETRLPEDSPVRADLSQVKAAAVKAAALTRQLLTFARKQVTEPRVIKLGQTAEELRPMLERLIGENIELIVESSGDEWDVLADAGQVEQVVMNLVVNARDAMPKGGKIVIESQNIELEEGIPSANLPPGQYVLLSVADNGHGMDAKTCSHIFEPFYTTKPQGRGTGLGLSTCYGIVSEARGHIWVYSEPGHGTTFKIYLPRTTAKVMGVSEPGAPKPTHSEGEVILLVEDEAMVRALSVEALKAQGYDIYFATNGREALEWLSSYDGPLDLVISDVVMPEMGGPEMVEHLEVIRPGIPVLFTSGYTDDAIVHHGILESDRAFLQKPYSPTKLAEKVREVLGAARRERAA